MALSRRALSDYDSSLSQVEKAAADYVRRRVDAYLASYPGASAADVREFAVEVVSDAVSVYGDAASTAAADLYDELAVASPEPLPTAAVDTSDVSGTWTRRSATRLESSWTARRRPSPRPWPRALATR